mmetsp:Transcript_22243/g.24730  ORF Transcript_22243/g.24730 Transcript_22243/m.24730 type:complete len:151 (-) Transcript_22243:289-741(-)
MRNKLKKLNKKMIKYLVYFHFEDYVKDFKKYELWIHVKTYSVNTIFKKLKNLEGQRIPSLEILSLQHIAKRDKNVVHLLTHCFPSKVDKFYFDVFSSNAMKPMSFYIRGLCKALPSVTKVLWIKGLVMTKKQFQTFIAAAGHIQDICLFG